MRWWFVLVAGAVFLLAPGYMNPTAVINGSTIIGLGLLVWASYRLAERGMRA
jgi:hypothetical protein